MTIEDYTAVLNKRYTLVLHSFVSMTSLKNGDLLYEELKAKYRFVHDEIKNNPQSLKFFHRITSFSNALSNISCQDDLNNVPFDMFNCMYDVDINLNMKELMLDYIFEPYLTEEIISERDDIIQSLISNLNSICRLTVLCKINREIPLIDSITETINRARTEKGNLLGMLMEDITKKPSIRRNIQDLTETDSKIGDNILDNISDILKTYAKSESDRKLYTELMKNMKPLLTSETDLEFDQLDEHDRLKNSKVPNESTDTRSNDTDKVVKHVKEYEPGEEDSLLNKEFKNNATSDDIVEKVPTDTHGSTSDDDNKDRMRKVLGGLNDMLKDIHKNPDKDPDIMLDKLGDMMNDILPGDKKNENMPDFKDLYKTMSNLNL